MTPGEWLAVGLTLGVAGGFLLLCYAIVGLAGAWREWERADEPVQDFPDERPLRVYDQEQDAA